MAEPIKNKLYQVSIGSRWKFQFIQAENDEDLIRYLAKNHPDKFKIYGACEFRPDGSTRTAKIISHPLFEMLYADNEARGMPSAVPAGVALIDGRPWAITLPRAEGTPEAPSDFEIFRTAANVKCLPASLQECASWSLEGTVQPDYGLNQEESREAHSDFIGYRPVIVPLNRDTLEPEFSFFLGREDGDIFCFGALYMDGVPVHNPRDPFRDSVSGEIPDYIPGTKLHIGSTSANYKNHITWVKTGNKLVASCNLLKNISWSDLDRMGLVRGPEHLQKKAPFEKVLADAQTRANLQSRPELAALHPDKEK